MSNRDVSPYTKISAVRPPWTGAPRANKLLLKYLSFLVVSAAVLPSEADAESFYGRISSIAVTDTYNYPFRIYMPGLSGCAYNFIYIDSGNTNYSAYYNVLLSFFNTGRAINVQYDIESSGFCKMNYVSN